MYEIKKIVHDLMFKLMITKKIYISLSYVKWKIYYGLVLALPILKYKNKNSEGVFLVFTPEHANLGDHAIAYVEQKMLERMKVSFFEITGNQLSILDQYNYLDLLNGANIFVNGGGNLGDLWPDIEKLNRRLIMSNPKSTILILPNTIYYSEDEIGQKEFQLSKDIYNAHPNLYIYAREMKSYEKMKNAYKNVKLVPDMVLSLDLSLESSNREGCIICLRKDVESTLSEIEYEYVNQFAINQFKNNVKHIDTVLNYNVSIRNREKELINFFSILKQTNLVITDRLHGMIFCAITGTNCLVLNSKSPKLLGCYQWIKNLNYIMFVDNIYELSKVYNNFDNTINKYNNAGLHHYYSSLEDDIMSIVNSNKAHN